MSWMSRLITLWTCSAPSLLLVGLVGRQLGLGVGLQVVQTLNCSRWATPSDKGVFEDGDVILGGLFNLYYIPPTLEHDFTRQPQYKSCTGLQNLPLQYIYALMFALDEINHSPTLLPGVKLSYFIRDSCAFPTWALQAALSLVSGDTPSCNPAAGFLEAAGIGAKKRDPPIPLIIGGDSSITAQALSRILGPLSVPLVSYTASCPCLSDRREYSNFFRTMASDIYQARAFVQLALKFNWTWVGAVIANNDYGLNLLKIFQEGIQEAGVCLAFVETLQRESIVSDTKRAALTIQASTVKVILVFTWYTDVKELFVQLANINVTDRQFIASEAWSTSSDLLKEPASSKVAGGVFGVAIRSSFLPGFDSYIRKLNPSLRPNDKFLREFWENQFRCSPGKTSLSTSLPACNGSETLAGVHNLFTDTTQLRVTYNVYLAVYAAAHALHTLFSCPDINSPPGNSSTCLVPNQISPSELFQHLSNVKFTTPQGELFYFQGADTTAKYDLLNWQKTPDGQLKIALVGRIDGFDMHLNESAIQWHTGSSQVPVSVCSERCPLGTRMASRKGEPICCFDCIPCADGEISNKTGALQCDRCPTEFWSNSERSACIVRQLDFLAYNETLGITLTAVAVSGVTATTIVFVVFIYYRQTPMVRANNSELSFLLLLSLKLCFLCSLVFIGRPAVWSCRFQQAAFGISFVLSISCLQVKTMVVLAAFRSARPGAEALMKWFGPAQQRGSVCVFTCVQVIICVIWLSVSPPVPQPDFAVPGLKVTLKCAMDSVVGFSLVLGYIGLLGCTSLLLAFLARKLPDNFNEAKLITFSMLIFCAVWVAFVPAYVSSPGKYAVAVEIFAILASSYGLLFCIFAPKCFIILLRPEKNTKKHLMAR
ncbi:olfactory receptor CR1 isoform X2 [Austrofundulus limnaeus]|uniref:Olfactory receptor CR1 isoform X2 n=1 Tax=Austrofundulus limnaeus TaxID=52670 RepID=A0A2I4BJC1_AUSLI|nr:PREDICTED: extracellular calcium-sensing receptor-like isoform X2 [Austrofundulus limnaeus]